MYLMSIDDVLFDEYFLYEYNKCQMRAFMFSKSNYVITLADFETKKDKKYKSKKYVHHDETLKYKILKNLYYKTFSMIVDKGISMDKFKELALVILEKEINLNKKKSRNKRGAYYDGINKSIILNLEKHFNLINEFDMKDSIDSFISIKVDLKEYLQFRESKINPIYSSKLIKVDWDQVKGSPKFLLNFINLKKDEDGISIVMTSPLNIDDKLIHRNFYISFIIQYVYYFYPKEKLIKIFGTDKVNINKLIVYYPLNFERKEYKFKDIVGVYQEMDMLRIIRIFLEKLYIRTNDTKECKSCENQDFCYHRTNAKTTSANNIIYRNAENKTKIII